VEDVDGLLGDQLGNVPDNDLLAELLVRAHSHQKTAVRAEGSKLQQTCVVVMHGKSIVDNKDRVKYIEYKCSALLTCDRKK